MNNITDASSLPMDVQNTCRDIGYLIVTQYPELLDEIPHLTNGDNDEVSCVNG